MTNYNDSVLGLTLCLNYCLYAATVGVADAVNTLLLFLSSFFLSADSFCISS